MPAKQAKCADCRRHRWLKDDGLCWACRRLRHRQRDELLTRALGIAPGEMLRIEVPEDEG